MKDAVSPLLTPVVHKEYAPEIGRSKPEIEPMEEQEESPEAQADPNENGKEQDVESQEPKETPDEEVENYSSESDIQGFQVTNDDDYFDDEEGDSVEGGLATTDDDDEWDGAEDTSSFALDLLENVVPEVLHNKSKLGEKSFSLLEKNNQILAGTTDQIVEINKNNKKAFKSVFKDKRKIIEKPLKQVLEKRGAKASPESRLIIGLIVVGVLIYLQFKEVREENAIIRDRIFKRNQV